MRDMTQQNTVRLEHLLVVKSQYLPRLKRTGSSYIQSLKSVFVFQYIGIGMANDDSEDQGYDTAHHEMIEDVEKGEDSLLDPDILLNCGDGAGVIMLCPFIIPFSAQYGSSGTCMYKSLFTSFFS